MRGLIKLLSVLLVFAAAQLLIERHMDELDNGQLILRIAVTHPLGGSDNDPQLDAAADRLLQRVHERGFARLLREGVIIEVIRAPRSNELPATNVQNASLA